MGVIGLILGIISFFWMAIALIPFLGWLNWINIPIAAIGLIFSILSYTGRKSSVGMAGIILNGAAILIGLLRLGLGGGIL